MKTKHCVACLNTENLHNHYLAPRIRGGGDEETNLITLCSGCHGKIHGKPDMWLNHKKQTIAGIKRAKENGAQLGNPPTVRKLHPLQIMFCQPYYNSEAKVTACRPLPKN